MKLPEPQNTTYSKEQFSAREAQQRAQEIAWGPITFQVSRLMVKFGIFELLSGRAEGTTLEQVAEHAGLTRYATQILLESSLTAQTILMRDDRFFLVNDPMSKANINFNHDVNYLGLFDLEAALRNGKPEGLKRLGPWKTIYEGLSQLPPEVQESWFGFDHFYSAADRIRRRAAHAAGRGRQHGPLGLAMRRTRPRGAGDGNGPPGTARDHARGRRRSARGRPHRRLRRRPAEC